MIVKLGLKCTVYKTTKNTFKDASGNDIAYYKAIVEQGDDVASISCAEDAVKGIVPMEQNNMICEYNTESKKLRIVAVAKAK